MIRYLYMLFALLTAIVGYHIHNSIFWSIVDYIFCPFVIGKWFVYHEITLSIIKSTFMWFFV